MAVVVGAAYVEARAGALAAEAGDEARLGLLVAGVDGAYLHAAAHDLQQPLTRVHVIPLQVKVKRAVPTRRISNILYVM